VHSVEISGNIEKVALGESVAISWTGTPCIRFNCPNDQFHRQAPLSITRLYIPMKRL
jgi:hypothetical protein